MHKPDSPDFNPFIEAPAIFEQRDVLSALALKYLEHSYDGATQLCMSHVGHLVNILHRFCQTQGLVIKWFVSWEYSIFLGEIAERAVRDKGIEIVTTERS